MFQLPFELNDPYNDKAPGKIVYRVTLVAVYICSVCNNILFDSLLWYCVCNDVSTK